MKNKNQDSLIKSVQQTISEVKDILAKAGVDYDEEEMPEEGMEEEMPEEGMDQEMPEEGMDQEMPEEGMEEEMPEEDMDQEMPEDDLVSHLQGLEDEELQELLSAIQSELESRQDGQEDIPKEGMEYSPGEMKKSIESLSSAISQLTSQVSDMKKQNSEQRKRLAKSSKVAASNKVDIMQKSTESKTDAKPEKLSKSDLIETLLNRRRNGDSSVTSNLINDLRYFNNDDEMYHYLKIKGIKID